MNMIIRETITVPATPAAPVTPPIPWKRELNLPPASWFQGEWFAARQEREARELALEKDNDTLKKWLRVGAWLIAGIGFVGGSLAGYLAMIALVGSP